MKRQSHLLFLIVFKLLDILKEVVFSQFWELQLKKVPASVGAF